MSEPFYASLAQHKLLVANRGEIAVRILKTAKRLKLRTVAVYTQVDATSPHVLLADEAVALSTPLPASDANVGGTPEDDTATNARTYLDAFAIVNVCLEKNVTLVHPGYGFLSENAHFARLLLKHGLTLLGPSVQTIEEMGLKHRARDLAARAGVPIVPGSNGLVTDIDSAERIVEAVGFPVMLKATAGGGGMGLVVCRNINDLRKAFEPTRQRAKSLFHDDGVFVEKYFDISRHIEVQILGNGCGHVIHMGERECSVQRRHQKIIEESPSPYLAERQDLRDRICSAAVQLGKLINYKSAGTVEFIVDDPTGKFYFLEMNTRLQVEHGVTEMFYPGLDIVELMILQGVCEHQAAATPSVSPFGLSEERLIQEHYAHIPDAHVIEVRVYSENPKKNFAPSPGVLQYVELPEPADDLRIDTSVSTGMAITPFYDPLIAKVIVRNPTRQGVIEQISSLLADDSQDVGSRKRFLIQGPPNNLEFLVQVLRTDTFKEGKSTTRWIDSGGVNYIPSAITIVSPGLSTSVQSLPARDIGLGIPPSGPMDPLSLQAGNALVGNPFECEGLELVIPPTGTSRGSGISFTAIFHVRAVIAVTGADAIVQLDGQEVPIWSRLVLPAEAKLTIGSLRTHDEGNNANSAGFRAYLCIAGGFPGIPMYIGSKSTSMGSGGYQGRNLQAGDLLKISTAMESLTTTSSLPRASIPQYPSDWTIYSLSGPHDDEDYLTKSGIEAFYARRWRVSTASNRMGIRLDPVSQEDSDSDSDVPVLQWARYNGGEGGSHPSNILDNGYARGSINLNGDTPVILTNEGPSMGGYVCVSTIATADQWKLGQLRPGDTLQFKRIAYEDAITLRQHIRKWLETVLALSSGFNAHPINLLDFTPSNHQSLLLNPKLHVIPATLTKPKVVFRQAGDSAILVEYGEMTLDFAVRARIHGLETAIHEMQISGIRELALCIRTTMVHYDPEQISQGELLSLLVRAEHSLPESIADMQFPGRKLTFPIVLDDRWNNEALERYMRTMRDKAVYLPSNIEYLARNNGIEGGKKEALKILVSSSWLVFGVGFYLACPFLVPVDPRCRLVGQKMNPSRTYTPRGAVGIAGLVAAIYPVESPGGYQLFGRTLPTWQPWGKGTDFSPDKPWLLEPFDQVVFEPISEDLYLDLEKDFERGRYKFKIEDVVFSMKTYLEFIEKIQEDLVAFKERQAKGVASEEAREHVLLKEWQASQQSNIDASAVVQDSIEETPNFASATLAGAIWKIRVALDDVIESADQIVLILEAMKTEIPIFAGEENVGLKISGFANGVREGATVQAGDKLVFFA